jgi:Domain of unknown function (DUF2017)
VGDRGEVVIVLELSDVELQLLRTLLAQYDDVVQSDTDDSAVQRLFPAGYRDDPDAAAEFSRYTRAGLVETKSANAGALGAAILDSDGTIELTDEAAERWLPVLTDLRLIIAERIGITADEDPVPDDELGEVYHWLAELQTYLIEALDALDPRA